MGKRNIDWISAQVEVQKPLRAHSHVWWRSVEPTVPASLPALQRLRFIQVLPLTHDALQLHLQDTPGDKNKAHMKILLFPYLLYLCPPLLTLFRPVPCKFDLLLLLDFLLSDQLSALSMSGCLLGPDALQLLAQLPVLRPEGLVALLCLLHLLFHFCNLCIEGFYPLHCSSNVQKDKFKQRQNEVKGTFQEEGRVSVYYSSLALQERIAYEITACVSIFYTHPLVRLSFVNSKLQVIAHMALVQATPLHHSQTKD